MKILVLPDMHNKEGTPTEHLGHIGQFIVDKQPDVIIHLGDFADMPSLSLYDVGKKCFEGRSYTNDIQASHEAMRILLSPLFALQCKQKRNKEKMYNPRRIMLLGNHENRINRAIELDRKLEGLMSVNDLLYAEFGWEVVGFLEKVKINGVLFSHYFTSGEMGRAITSPNALLTKKHVSCVMGHNQKDGIASQYTGDDKRITGIFAGACYLHQEDYLGPQGNVHWRGVWMLHDVMDGEFEPMQVSLKFLKERYGK